MHFSTLHFLLLLILSVPRILANDNQLRIATFKADATPPLGSPLCNGNVKPVMKIVTPLTARGIVLFGDEQPVAMVALDWVGIGNESFDQFRRTIADAIGTTAERVALHTLHQHDAPGSDFATERLLARHGLGGLYSNPEFDTQTMEAIAAAAKAAVIAPTLVTHMGVAAAKVDRVASNRRILGPNGKVSLQRQSSGGRNPAAAAAPEGVIDPLVRMMTLWSDETPLVAITWYATHPQSYYGQGSVNWDFVGMARELRQQALPDVPHIHFNGAGGNIAAGKYNDGSKENRPILASRLAEGMKQAWRSQVKSPISASDLAWRIVPVSLPVSSRLQQAELQAKIANETLPHRERLRAARDLTFVTRMNSGHQIPLTCLSLGPADILHLPGELFVEYQLAAQQMQPDRFVTVAAYGDYGPGYIGTQIAYAQGGYETGIVSRVSPDVEVVLLQAVKQLLQDR
ncbi:MAG: hypothetical protein ACPGXX_05235 [Planctomycetaceae bacterium]